MSKQTFGEMLKTTQVPVLVDFYADWCGPCQSMKPVLEALAKDAGDKLKIIKVDIDRNQAAAQQLGIRGVPTFILFKDGREVWRQAGAMPRAQLERAINAHMS